MKTYKKCALALFVVGLFMTATLFSVPAQAFPAAPPPADLYGTYVLDGPESAYLIVYTLMHDITTKEFGTFQNENMREVLAHKLQIVLNLLEDGEYQEAHDKIVNDILPKVDGKWMTVDWDNLPYTVDPDEKDYRVWLTNAADYLLEPEEVHEIIVTPYWFCVICPHTCFALWF